MGLTEKFSRKNKFKEPTKESVTLENIGSDSETSIEEILPTENTQEEKPKDEFVDKEEVQNTLEIQESIKLHNKKIVVVEIPNSESMTDHGGLKGNPGQQSRFNSLMENKHSGTAKYFHSGKKG